MIVKRVLRKRFKVIKRAHELYLMDCKRMARKTGHFLMSEYTPHGFFDQAERELK